MVERYNPEQTHLFESHLPELKDKYRNSKFRVSILGGSLSIEIARNIAYDLTKNFYPIQTGGYDAGAMKGALEGADLAIKEMHEDPDSREFVNLVDLTPKGIVAENVTPELSTKGEYVATEITTGPYDLYQRLGKLMEDASAVVVLQGESGTELEIIANLHFDKKLKKYANLQPKPLVFWRNFSDQFLKDRKDIIENDPNIFQVSNSSQLLELFDNIQKIQNHPEADEETEELKKLISEKYHYKFLWRK